VALCLNRSAPVDGWPPAAASASVESATRLAVARPLAARLAGAPSHSATSLRNMRRIDDLFYGVSSARRLPVHSDLLGSRCLPRAHALLPTERHAPAQQPLSLGRGVVALDWCSAARSNCGIGANGAVDGQHQLLSEPSESPSRALRMLPETLAC
jgi:hypothetical protein